MHVIDDNGNGFDGVQYFDVNGDGKLDILASAVDASGKVSVLWLSYANSPFETSWQVHEINNEVNIFDIIEIIKVYDKTCSDQGFNERADVKEDCAINIFDIIEVIKHFGVC